MPLVRGNLTVDANERVAVGVRGAFQNVEHSPRLAEHERPVTVRREVPEQGHEERALTGGVGGTAQVGLGEARVGDGGGDGGAPGFALVPILLFFVDIAVVGILGRGLA